MHKEITYAILFDETFCFTGAVGDLRKKETLMIDDDNYMKNKMWSEASFLSFDKIEEIKPHSRDRIWKW